MKYLVVLMSIFILTACAVKKIQTATQSTLNAMSRCINTIDNIASEHIAIEAGPNRLIASEITDRLNGERVVCLETNNNPEDCTDEIDELELYDDLMQDLENLVVGAETARAVLVLGQESLDAWIATGDLDHGQWYVFCSNIEGSFTDVVDLLRALGIDIPNELMESLRYSRIVCGVVANFFGDDQWN